MEDTMTVRAKLPRRISRRSFRGVRASWGEYVLHGFPWVREASGDWLCAEGPLPACWHCSAPATASRTFDYGHVRFYCGGHMAAYNAIYLGCGVVAS